MKALAEASGLAFLILSSYSTNNALAQIVPDDSLGLESSVVQPGEDSSNVLIQGGARLGANLFHSFEQFDVNGQGVYFNNPDGVSLIVGRVTGSNPSNILGTLGVAGEGVADLFLINPNGIAFGPDAVLDLNGSFLATTADALVFENGYEFSASNLVSPPLLTVTTPVGLQFGETVGGILNQAAVRIEDNIFGIEVEPGNTLALVGGQVTMQSGFLRVSDGRIEIGSVAANNLVGLQPVDLGWALNYENVQGFEDIQLLKRSIEGSNEVFDSSFVQGDGDNQVTNIQGRNILLRDGSQFRNFGLSLTVTASETVELVGISINPISRTGLIGLTSSDANAGSIVVNTRRLIVRDGAGITTASSGQLIGPDFIPASGRGGILTVNASELVEVRGNASELVEVRVGDAQLSAISQISAGTIAFGDAGSLTINTRRLVVQDGAQISTSSSGADPFGRPLATGAGGDIFINADESVDLINNGSILTESLGQGGAAGNLNLRTRLLTLRDESILSAETVNDNQGGNINLLANDLLFLRGNSRISATAGTAQAGGDGGNVAIAADLIFAPPGENSDITANAFSGRGGRVEITSDNILGLAPLSGAELQALLGTDDPTSLDPSLLPSNDITAISQENPSLDGEVIINSPDLDLNRAAEELPRRFETPRVSQGCQARGGPAGQFTSSGQGGLTPGPYEPLGGGGIQDDIYPAGQTISQAIAQPDVITEAKGWMTNPEGDVVLVAEAFNVASVGSCGAI
ncbi:MAG: filamentous hemagglutinin N-terminal domain-containing protein [Cyanobacteria bacterium J06635_1]